MESIHAFYFVNMHFILFCFFIKLFQYKERVLSFLIKYCNCSISTILTSSKVKSSHQNSELSCCEGKGELAQVGIKQNGWGFKSVRTLWITAHFILGEKFYVNFRDSWLKLSRFLFLSKKVVWKVVDLKNDPNKLIILPNINLKVTIMILKIAVMRISINKKQISKNQKII